MIEAASASPPNKKKKERAGSMQLFRHIVLSAALHTHMHKKKDCSQYYMDVQTRVATCLISGFAPSSDRC
jgi:hypothetical protein